ncbi:MAG TPA: response regulator [Patescibacteria group bacterium]|nr:response regulator [Patescibacteria group bacterium]
MQPVDLNKYKTLYLQTAQQYLQQYSTNLNAFLKNQTEASAFEQMFIAIHSIKSQSLVMGYTTLGNYCKEVEMKMREVKDGKTAISQEILNYLQQAQQKITTELQTIQTTGKDIEQIQTAPAPGITQNGKRILLIEDDNFFEQFYAYKLRQQGFNVDTAKDGNEGMSLMLAHVPNLILLDLIMPIKDGFEVLAEKQRINLVKNVPVIVFSTLGQEEDIEKAKKLGAVDFINKGFIDYDSLLEKIKTKIS